MVERPEVRKSVGPSSLASRLIGLCARNRRWSSWRQLGDLHPRVSRRLSCFVAPGALIWACLLSVGHGHYGGCGCCDEGRRFCWSSLVGMGSGWMAPTCSAPRAEAGGADGQIPLRYLGAEQARNGGGSARREPAMSWHMAGGCPPRSAVASGPLKCGPFFPAGSCAFGLFVIRRFGESERVSGPGATPPLASSLMRIGSELFRARGWPVGRARPRRVLGSIGKPGPRRAVNRKTTGEYNSGENLPAQPVH